MRSAQIAAIDAIAGAVNDLPTDRDPLAVAVVAVRAIEDAGLELGEPITAELIESAGPAS